MNHDLTHDVLGVSGRKMIEALIAGEKDVTVLAELASFENTCAGMIRATQRPPASVIPAKAGIQANSAENKSGFPPARE